MPANDTRVVLDREAGRAADRLAAARELVDRLEEMEAASAADQARRRSA